MLRHENRHDKVLTVLVREVGHSLYRFDMMTPEFRHDENGKFQDSALCESSAWQREYPILTKPRWYHKY